MSANLPLPKHKLPRLLLLATAFSAIAAAATVARLRFDPYALHRLTQPPRSMFRTDPASFGLTDYQLVNLITSDALTLRGRFFPAYHYEDYLAHSAIATPRGSIILLHGYAGSHDTLLEYASWLVSAGYNVLAYDQRGCGQSDGERITMGALESMDVAAAISWLHGHGERKLAIWGFSMGGTTAILAAAAHPELRAVITDCAFAKLEREIESSMLERGYPRFITIPLSRMTAATLTNHLEARRGDYDAVDVVSRIAPRPLLLVHAAADTLVDPADAEALYEAASAPCELWITPHSLHTQSYHDYPHAYQQRVLAILERAFGN